MMYLILDILTIASLIFGMFFMIVAAIGLLRLPDFYHRMHAATKGVTLGITGLLLAGMFSMSAHPDAAPVAVITRALLVILFQFVANPVGAHLLSKAAHMDHAPIWKGTITDALGEDRKKATENQ